MRLSLLLVAALAFAACASETDESPETAVDMTDVADVPDTPPADDTTDALPLDAPSTADPTSGAKTGVEVCEALMAGLAADAAGEPVDVSLYATEAVLRTLYDNNPFAQPGAEAGDVAAWVDDDAEGTCNLSAGGDAWYELTLQTMPDDDPGGQWATGLDVKTSYD